MQVDHKSYTEHDASTKDQVLDLRLSGTSYTELRRTFGISKSTVRMWERRYREDGRDWHRKPRIRKEVMIPEKDLREYLEANPSIPVRKIAKHFKCHTATIYLAFKRHSIKHIVPRSPRPKKKLDFAKITKYVEENPDVAVPDIAKRFNCTFTIIRDIQKRHRLKSGVVGRKAPIKTIVEEIKEYLCQNPTARPNEIAMHFDYDKRVVYRLLQQENIPYVKKNALGFVGSEEYVRIYYGMQKSWFTTETKTEAVRRVVEGEKVQNVANDLGISGSTISRWHKIFLSNFSMAIKKKEAVMESAETLFFMQRTEMLELEFLKNVVGEFAYSLDSLKKVALIEKHAEKLGSGRACALLKISPEMYYYWQKRTETAYARKNREDTEKIIEVFNKTGEIYGARKMVHALRAAGITIGQVRVSRLMKNAGLKPIVSKKRTLKPKPSSSKITIPNLLQRDFRTTHVNLIWATDITYIKTDEGWLYLCCVIDLYSRRIVGWAADSRMTHHLAVTALSDAIESRNPAAGFILHSDRGSQYTSKEFGDFVGRHGGIQSMSDPASPADNACIESFFYRLKSECANRHHFYTRQKAREILAEYIDYYNNERIHSKLEYMSPVDFEKLKSATS